MKYLAILTVLLLSGCTSDIGYAYTQEQAIKAVIGEAENQGEYGMLAVSCAIRNRGSLKGVYGLHAPRVVKHRYSNKIYQQAKSAWLEANEKPDVEGADNCGMINGATFWEGTAFPIPYWAKSMTLTATIGNQRFFKE